MSELIVRQEAPDIIFVAQGSVGPQGPKGDKGDVGDMHPDIPVLVQAAASSAAAAAQSAINAESVSRLTVGSVSVLEHDQAPVVTITGESGSQVVSFEIPRGIPGLGLESAVAKTGDTMTGKLVLQGTASAAPLNIPSVGSAQPTALVDGDIWSHSNQLRAMLSGTARTLIHDGNPTTLAADVSQVEAEAGVATTRRWWSAARVFQSVAGWWNGSAHKAKLDGIETGANKYTHPASHPPSIIDQDSSNRFVTDAEKATWNGKEPTITAGTTSQYWRGDKSWRDFATDVRAAVLTGLSTATSTVVAAADSVLVAIGKLQAQITGHTGNTSNPHSVTKSQVGLGNVDNTSDTNKPVSTAQQAALNLKADKTTTISAGTGLSGGGDLSANRTLSVAYGTTAGTAAQGNDSRLSDAREWTATTVEQAEAEAGTATTRRAWTAQRVRQSNVAWWDGVRTSLAAINSSAITENSRPVVVDTDIGLAPNQIPLNLHLGSMAYMEPENVVIRPQASASPGTERGMVFELTNDTTLVVKVRGTDGTVRSATLTLA